MHRSVNTAGIIALGLVVVLMVGARSAVGAIVVALVLVVILGARFSGWGRGMWPPAGPFRG
jgi:hypothetical protein